MGFFFLEKTCPTSFTIKVCSDLNSQKAIMALFLSSTTGYSKLTFYILLSFFFCSTKFYNINDTKNKPNNC